MPGVTLKPSLINSSNELSAREFIDPKLHFATAHLECAPLIADELLDDHLTMHNGNHFVFLSDETECLRAK